MKLSKKNLKTSILFVAGVLAVMALYRRFVPENIKGYIGA